MKIRFRKDLTSWYLTPSISFDWYRTHCYIYLDFLFLGCQIEWVSKDFKAKQEEEKREWDSWINDQEQKQQQEKHEL